MEYNRRNFIKVSGVGVTGAFLAGNINANPLNKPSATSLINGKVITRTLGRTGLNVPVVSMGAMRADNPQLLKAAYEGGIIHFDSAQSYQEGRNEEMLGNFMQQYKRESFIVSTKIGLRQQNISKNEFFSKVDLSLQRLKTSYIDILYLHGVRDKNFVLNPEIINMLTEIKKTGKVKFVGISTHSNMAEVIRASAEGKVYDVVLTSYNFKLDNIPDLNQAIAKAAKAGMGIIAMKTMAGVYWDKEKTRKINTKAALKWVLQNENIHTSIPGFTSFEQLEDSLSVMADLKLNEKELNDLKTDNSVAGLFCLGCENCLSQCPNGMQIPDIMRSYMYVYGYKDLKLAKDVIDSLPANSLNSCSKCSECSVNCTLGFDIKQKTMDIIRVKDIPAEFMA